MSNTYQRRSIHNLDEMNTEQERIQSKVRQIEDDILGIFSPGNLAVHAASMLLGSRLTGKQTTRRNKTGNAPTGIKTWSPGPKTKNKLIDFSKRVGISFLKWQAFNLALYLSGKAIREIREKRALNKLKPPSIKKRLK